MPVICPTVLAKDEISFKSQLDKVAGFSHRIQIDLGDGKFTETKTIDPAKAWWPAGVKADVHLMFQHPLSAVEQLLDHDPHLLIVHAEAEGSFESVLRLCRDRRIKVGVALLPKTQPHAIENALAHIDHVLIFSGNLGSFGGHANLDHLHKVRHLKEAKPSLEIGWDGGINGHNISQLAFGGVDVFNVGSFIQNSADPEKAYRILDRIAQETGTT